MNGTPTIGIDTAKRILFLHGEDVRGKVALRQKLSQERLLPVLANQPVSTIAIEAGCGAHHWARALSKCRHQQFPPPESSGEMNSRLPRMHVTP